MPTHLQTVQQDICDAGLPQRKKVAPNQHTVTETVETMGIQVKSKQQQEHQDPYSENEHPGKKARDDARQPLNATLLGANVAQFLNAKRAAQHAPLAPPVSPTPPVPTSTSLVFDRTNPALFDLHHLTSEKVLANLLCADLNIITKFYNLKCVGSNFDLTANLVKHAKQNKSSK
ncbi:hypothetical protein C8J56DRAFT_888255 [Mycena floridula]|nr:hypothetical protein C8J56DRAFT_888255 [Mycena floridula]